MNRCFGGRPCTGFPTPDDDVFPRVRSSQDRLGEGSLKLGEIFTTTPQSPYPQLLAYDVVYCCFVDI